MRGVISQSMKRLGRSTVLVGFMMLGTSCCERPEVFYADLAAAERDGAIQRGWIRLDSSQRAYDSRDSRSRHESEYAGVLIRSNRSACFRSRLHANAWHSPPAPGLQGFLVAG